MLSHLRIQNLIVVEEATLALDPGLNVLSGETGAGKSVLLAAVALVTGARGRADWIRPGADRAVVEAFFVPDPALVAALAAQGIEAGEEGLQLKRELRADGRSQAWCEGFPLTLRRLREIGGLLVERQDQHAQLDLVEDEAQRRLLDDAAENGERLARYRECLAVARAAHRAEEQLAARLAALRGDEDYLRFQLEEIEALAPQPREREELEQRERRLRNATRLQESYRGLLQLIDGKGGLREALGGLEAQLAKLERLGDAPLSLASGEFTESLAELARILRHRAEDTLLAAREGEQLAERLGRLSALERKHGQPLETVLTWATEQRALIDQLADQDALLARRAAEREAAEVALAEAAFALSAARQRAAAALGPAWEAQLALLGLPRAALRIAVSPQAAGDGWVRDAAGQAYRAAESGIDRVEILVRPNPDLPEGSLAELPSGGELSRIAFARHLAGAAPQAGAPVLVLDEVDAGIGADLASALAAQLGALARQRQVLLVTHQARLAAVADRQFCVRKTFSDGRTRTNVLALETTERQREIARMLGESEPQADTLALAGRLLAEAAAAGGTEISLAMRRRIP